MTVLNKGTKKTQVVEKNKTKTIAAAPTMEKTKYKYTHKSADGRSKKLTIYKTARGKYVVFVNDKKKYLDMNKLMKGGADCMLQEEADYYNKEEITFKIQDVTRFFRHDNTTFFETLNFGIIEDNLTKRTKEYLNNPTSVFKTINGGEFQNQIDLINPKKTFTFEQLKFIIMYKLAYEIVFNHIKHIEQINSIKINNIILQMKDYISFNRVLYDGNGMLSAYKYIANNLISSDYFSNYTLFDALQSKYKEYKQNTNQIQLTNLTFTKTECGKRPRSNTDLNVGSN